MTSVAGCERCGGSCCRQSRVCLTRKKFHSAHTAARPKHGIRRITLAATPNKIYIYHALPSSARAARTPLPCADLGEPLSLPEDKRPPSLPADGAELMGRGGTIAAAQGVTNEAQGTTTEEMWEWI